MTTSPVPLHRPQREPFLLRPLPRHLGHFLALMTDILKKISLELGRGV